MIVSYYSAISKFYDQELRLNRLLYLNIPLYQARINSEKYLNLMHTKDKKETYKQLRILKTELRYILNYEKISEIKNNLSDIELNIDLFTNAFSENQAILVDEIFIDISKGLEKLVKNESDYLDIIKEEVKYEFIISISIVLLILYFILFHAVIHYKAIKKVNLIIDKDNLI